MAPQQRDTQGQRGLTAVELIAVVRAVSPAVTAQLIPDTPARVAHEHPRARCRGDSRPQVHGHQPWLPPSLGASLTATPRTKEKTLPRPDFRGERSRPHRHPRMAVSQPHRAAASAVPAAGTGELATDLERGPPDRQGPNPTKVQTKWREAGRVCSRLYCPMSLAGHSPHQMPGSPCPTRSNSRPADG